MLRLDLHWIWDFRFADDGERFHAFCLKVPRALGDPDLRHWHATVGHATSVDLASWTELPDAVAPSEGRWRQLRRRTAGPHAPPDLTERQ